MLDWYEHGKFWHKNIVMVKYGSLAATHFGCEIALAFSFFMKFPPL
jgi:hypothetical protein